MLKSLQARIIAGIAATGVAVGGVTAVVILANQDAVETSADGQPDCPDHDGTSRCLPGTINENVKMYLNKPKQHNT